MPIFHITSEDVWASAQAKGVYEAESLATEGFIHCSDPHQVMWVAGQRFRGRTDLVLLQVDPACLRAEIRYENLEGGQDLFPHVYGSIPLEAVVDVTKFHPPPASRPGAQE